MGVPTFFKWLTMRNPKIIIDCQEPQEQAQESGNPEIDNFYIDMNGLIHPSCNPQSDNNIKIPSNFEQQCDNIFEYVDKLINIVRPKKLLYMAIDGVAPRAKMNQQRSRRFRTAQQSLLNEQKKKKLKVFYEQRGIYSQEIQDYVNKKSFDSNVITPGTEFLSNVSIALNYFVQYRMNTHPTWKHLKVIFSDANCPGQGQHKIMQFIRQQRACDGYNPNISHCLYGADADLIMLGLMTHQPHFYIIRETVVTNEQKRCTICGRAGHFFMNCKRGLEEFNAQQQFKQSINVNFQIICLQLVRDQLHFNFHKSIVPFGYSLERIIDDFIFMCFFVGNDFLPHLPSLNIRQGGIDVLLYLYEHTLYKMPDYLINCGIINLKSLQIFINQLAKLEDTLINEAIKREAKTRQRQINNKMATQQVTEKKKSKKQVQQYVTNPLEKFKQDLKQLTQNQFNLENYSEFSHPLLNYKQKFYSEKFRIQPKDFLQFRAKVSQSYIEALSWICLYYYKGVPSWSWHYPFHYSPFASDIKIQIVKLLPFQLGHPFKPFQQLMAVFPMKTCWALPIHLQWLMKQKDSPISDYFPNDFIIDVLGKKFAWLGEVLLPFIEQSRLLGAMKGYENYLNEEEKRRNKLGTSLLYQHNCHKLIDDHIENFQIKQTSHQLEGKITLVKDNHTINLLIKNISNRWPLLDKNNVICYRFIQPTNKQHDINLKKGVKLSVCQIDQQYCNKTDRRSFNGEFMIRLLDRIIDKPKIPRSQNSQKKTQQIIQNQKNYLNYNPSQNIQNNSRYYPNKNNRNQQKHRSKSRSRDAERKPSKKP